MRSPIAQTTDESAAFPLTSPPRYTFGTNFTRSGKVDVVPVGQLMGHKRLETMWSDMGHAVLNTTRRYTLPSDADKTRALDALTTDR